MITQATVCAAGCHKYQTDPINLEGKWMEKIMSFQRAGYGFSSSTIFILPSGKTTSHRGRTGLQV
jgi:hypothetical protein